MSLQPEPMRPEMMEITRRSYDAFNRRDLDALLAMYHSDCIWDMSLVEGWPESDPYRGHAGLRRIFDEVYVAWDDLQGEPRDMFTVGRRSLVSCHLRGRGRVSGAEVEVTWTQIGEFRDGLIYRVYNYSDRDAALRAAGVSD